MLYTHFQNSITKPKQLTFCKQNLFSANPKHCLAQKRRVPTTIIFANTESRGCVIDYNITICVHWVHPIRLLKNHFILLHLFFFSCITLQFCTDHLKIICVVTFRSLFFVRQVSSFSNVREISFPAMIYGSFVTC